MHIFRKVYHFKSFLLITHNACGNIDKQNSKTCLLTLALLHNLMYFFL